MRTPLTRTAYRWTLRLGIAALCLGGGLAAATLATIKNPGPDFDAIYDQPQTTRILDRQGRPLSQSYQERWNQYDRIALHDVPELLQNAFIVSEDQRFYAHPGVDWQARGAALWQRLTSGGQSRRGASTLTEQVVRMLHPRPRSLWSKWLEGWEAVWLERQTSKPEILEFYLNQVPFAGNRRGIVQAARTWFDRAPETLSPAEMLTLAILVRAPARFDPRRNEVDISGAMDRLAARLRDQGKLSQQSIDLLHSAPLTLREGSLAAAAPQFITWLRSSPQFVVKRGQIRTTLDAALQNEVQTLLEHRLSELAHRKVQHAAALVVDHRSREILAWASVGRGCRESADTQAGCKMDLVRIPRQPGSSMKPFLYASALDSGWTAATIIPDSPWADAVGHGLHRFHNYSRIYYGQVTLRQALGNSLNIPAIHAVNAVGPEQYLRTLHRLGFSSLDQPSWFYDDGLALGVGEVSLFEQVQGYAALADRGRFRPLKAVADAPDLAPPEQIFSPETASIIGNILADPWARHWEFGRFSVLNLPVQTAVKTGTSQDYRDAWVIGYNSRYVVGVWMGNLDREPMDEVTGSTGPALVMRSIFRELTKNEPAAPLYLSPDLALHDTCLPSTTGDDPCAAVISEYFADDKPTQDHKDAAQKPAMNAPRAEIVQPGRDLDMALDPRIPRDRQAFRMMLKNLQAGDKVRWIVDDESFGPFTDKSFLWPLQRGRHSVEAEITPAEGASYRTEPVPFRVR